ncbi:hypothetical protein FQR65_LT11327 [Abscondita terminalis]|nr:hypothetical protein FQR65_LT11327 [Abscondita terminalis]
MNFGLFVVLIPVVCGDVIHVLSTTPEPQFPPRPYAFGYAAGRFPGHIDRTHSEISDGTGTIKGSYSYVDPRHQIRTVEYVADKNGFHPILNKNPSPVPADTPIVALAKQKHLQQYNEIAHTHQIAPGLARVPVDSASVHHAKIKHLNLFQKIAEEHARIAAERQALELATANPHYVH